MPKRDTKLQKLSQTIHITVEELRGIGMEGLDRLFMEEYLIQADQLTDSGAVWDSGAQALAYRKRAALGTGHRIRGGQAAVEREERDPQLWAGQEVCDVHYEVVKSVL